MPTDPVEKVASSTMQGNKTTTAFKDDHSIEAEIAETTNEKKDETLSNYDAMNDYEATEDSQNTCQYCFQCPCWLEQGLYEKLLELEESLRDDDIEKKLSNKQIRHALYRESTAFIHGYLGKGNRIALPQCVRGDIMDMCPDPDGEYTGFRDVSK